MPVVPEPAATMSSTGFYQQPTAMPSSPQPQHTSSSSPNSGNAFLIAIEVIFSCLVIVVLLFCFFTAREEDPITFARSVPFFVHSNHTSSMSPTCSTTTNVRPSRPKTLSAKGRGGTTGLSFGTKSNMHNDDNDINNKAQ
ncbi:hypothetical protein HMPREF1544_02127 [Mucor circinelloides 1006PhL]|uniref:Uncharacterized protein n=1 Tax=Mucor circinelloides f. circinelloides (strain 1006PhL) TaxID=1220926 RepID=S2K6L6_MUCC1|nr:hypothetical protein HMPREF1544_02127 [Mucor circinelloides 1006PhL]